MAAEHEYVLGTNDAEFRRLGLQHRIWSRQAFDLWERAGFAPGQTILDVGCGPGYATIDLARLLGPTTRLIAVDASARFIELLRSRIAQENLENIETRVLDLAQLDLPANSIDAAYARWVLCFLPQPADVVRRVAAALRPGGVLAIQDYFSYASIALAPRSAAFERGIRAVVEAWKARVGDPDLAGHLPGMLISAGLRVREIRPILLAARPGTLLWQWPTSFFSNFLPTLVRDGYLSQQELADFMSDWEARSNDPRTFMMTPPVFDIIATRD